MMGTKSEIKPFLIPMIVKKKSETENESNTKAVAVGMPAWKKYLLGIALVIGLAGLILQAMAYINPADAPKTVTESVTDSMTTALSPEILALNTVSPPVADGESNFLGINTDDWSAFLTKVGFSFVIGFALGYVLRVFIKITLFFTGVVLLALFGLQYAGYINIDWFSLEVPYESFIAWLQPHFSDFGDFVTGNLPSSGMAAVGIVIGFKRK